MKYGRLTRGINILIKAISHNELLYYSVPTYVDFEFAIFTSANAYTTVSSLIFIGATISIKSFENLTTLLSVLYNRVRWII